MVDKSSTMFPQLFKFFRDNYIITETLGFLKLCVRWIPKQTREEHKVNRVTSAAIFLERFELESKDFLSSIVIEDKT